MDYAIHFTNVFPSRRLNQMAKSEIDFTGIPETPDHLRAASVVFVALCIKTNARECILQQEGLNYKNQDLGNWEIVCRKMKPKAQSPSKPIKMRLRKPQAREIGDNGKFGGRK
jgi:hypothetical protein